MGQRKVLFLVAVIVLLCMLPKVSTSVDFSFDAQPDPELQKYFQPQNSGWLGGDIASSTYLGNNRYLWLWGDTLVGNIQNNQRVVKSMPRNSLATVQVTDGTPSDKLKFHIRVNQTNPNGGFFSPNWNQTWYWPIQGAIINDALYIIAYNTFEDQGGPFGFGFWGTTVIRVSNPNDDVEQWEWTASDMTYANKDLNWAAGIVVDQKYVYLYGTGKEGTVLSRFTIDDFTQSKWTNQLFWGYDASHQPNWIPYTYNLALVPVLPSISEISVTYHKYMNAWMTMYMKFLGTTISISLSEQLNYPWSEFEPLYDVPAPYNNTKKVFCYAVKRHPEFEHADNELVFSYMSNTFDVNDLNTMLDVYVPQVVRVKISKGSSTLTVK